MCIESGGAGDGRLTSTHHLGQGPTGHRLYGIARSGIHLRNMVRAIAIFASIQLPMAGWILAGIAGELSSPKAVQVSGLRWAVGGSYAFVLHRGRSSVQHGAFRLEGHPRSMVRTIANILSVQSP